MVIPVNSNPPASERVTGGFEFNNKMTALAARATVAHSSMLQSSAGPAGEKRMDNMMLMMVERAEGVP